MMPSYCFEKYIDIDYWVENVIISDLIQPYLLILAVNFASGYWRNEEIYSRKLETNKRDNEFQTPFIEGVAASDYTYS